MSNDKEITPETLKNTAVPEDKDFISFSQIAKGKREVLLEHEGQLYRLRLTRNGKLILNK
ncbi:hemin uptake protein HemP [uncultured Rubinisphaera sp.]|uniref:hemin uptake protein HemP n=1 Tax=uncultured Rubinisphaera sp. TaxID=1678686 RepID=UPI0030DCC460